MSEKIFHILVMSGVCIAKGVIILLLLTIICDIEVSLISMIIVSLIVFILETRLYLEKED